LPPVKIAAVIGDGELDVSHRGWPIIARRLGWKSRR
jgi:hypothetical protein